jgi:hypothetical protein
VALSSGNETSMFGVGGVVVATADRNDQVGKIFSFSRPFRQIDDFSFGPFVI